MSNKTYKLIKFLFFTLFIYLLPAFIGVFINFFICGFDAFVYFAFIFVFFIYPFLLFFVFISEFQFDLNWFGAYITIYFIIFIYSIPFIFWYIEQTIFRAWIISMMGMFFGPGFIFFFPSGDYRDFDVFLPLITLCIFYIWLHFANIFQKEYFPENEFANRIRATLKDICYKT